MSQDPVIACFSLEMFSGLYLSAAFSHKNKTFYDYVFNFELEIRTLTRHSHTRLC